MSRIRLLALLAACSLYALAPSAYAVVLNPDNVIPGNINQLPLYGNVPKTQKMLYADQNFRDKVLSKIKDPRLAASDYLAAAWRAYNKHMLNEAVQDANAAWLLNYQDDGCYWVMAEVQRERGAPAEEAEALYVKALSLSDADRPALTEEYDAFHRGRELVRVDNAADIISKYLAARKDLTGK